MDWSNSLSRLLERPSTATGQAARWGLIGLRACLQTALDGAPDDPGGGDTRALLDAIAGVLRVSVEAVGPTSPPAAGGAPAATSILGPLADQVCANDKLRADLGTFQIRRRTDAETWTDLNHLFLRLPPPSDRQWRDYCLSQALALGARQEAVTAPCLPLPWTEEIYPGLSGAVQAPGLMSAKPERSGEADQLLFAGVVETCLWFSEHDPTLCHALRSVYRFGVRALAEPGAALDYGNELRRRWQKVESTPTPGANARTWLEDRLNLDEAIHSLFHLPPAAPGSWWDRVRTAARMALFRAQKVGQACVSQLQTLGGSFATIARQTDPNSPAVPYGPPGEVVACLRVFARLDGTELKGRVLYRPLEGP